MICNLDVMTVLGVTFSCVGMYQSVPFGPGTQEVVLGPLFVNIDKFFWIY